MSHSERVFRVFVSSTFTDFKAERDILQRRTFPNLTAYCLRYNARFQAIDLRWGVSEDASFDHKTMNICREELRRCQSLTPRPNFIILLGQRYGWRPIPAQIEASEFENLLGNLARPEHDQMLAWYRRDDNAVPPDYVLQLREGAYRDEHRWSETETALRRMFWSAIDHVLPPGDPRRQKYEDSATHQEIRAGALEADPTAGRALCYLRQFRRKADPNAPGTELFYDVLPDLNKPGTRTIDTEARDRLDRMRDEVTGRINDPRNIHLYHLECHERLMAPEMDSETAGALLAFAIRVEADLKRVIEEEVERAKKAVDTLSEADIHLAHETECRADFLGRENALERITAYAGNEDGCPLFVHGPTGSGKTALLAESAARLRAVGGTRSSRVVVARYIGATPASVDATTLLLDLCRSIGAAYGGKTPDSDNMRELSLALQRLMAMATAQRPLIILLDGLEQLSAAHGTHRFRWLPRTLPPHAGLVFSTTDDDGPTGECYRTLAQTVQPGNQVRIAPLTRAEGAQLLDRWMQNAGRPLEAGEPRPVQGQCGGRTLQPHQRAEVLDKFASNGLPLYLRMAFEEARRWRSYEPLPSTGLSGNMRGIIDEFLSRLENPALHGHAPVGNALSYLGISREGLSEDELLAALSSTPDVMGDFIRRSPTERSKEESQRIDHLPFLVWSRLAADLERFLVRRTAGGTHVLNLSYGSLREIVSGRYLEGPARAACHARLADVFEHRADPDKTGAWPLQDPHTMAEFPYHLLHGECWDRLESVLTDVRFLEAKTRAGLFEDLQADYRRAHEAVESQFENGEARSAVERILPFGRSLGNIADSIRGIPESLGPQLHLELQNTARDVQERALPHIEEALEGRAWLLRFQRTGRSSPGYLAQAALERTFIHTLAFSPDSRMLLYADRQGRLTRWKWADGDSDMTEAPAPESATMGFRHGALISSGAFLIASESSAWVFETVDIWRDELADGEWRQLLDCAKGQSLRRVVSLGDDSGALLARDGEPRGELLWLETATGTVRRHQRIPRPNPLARVNDIARSPVGNACAICYDTGDLAVSTGLLAAAHKGGATHCEFIHEGRALATCGIDGTLALWAHGEGLLDQVDLHLGPAECLAYAPETNLIAVGHRNGSLSLVDPSKNGTLTDHYPGIRGWVLSLAFSPGGRFLAVGGRNGLVRVFETNLLKNQTTEAISRRPTGDATAAAFMNASETCLFSDADTRLYSLSKEADTRLLPLEVEAWCPDYGREKAVALLRDKVQWLDPRVGTPVHTHMLEKSRYFALCQSQDGSMLATLRADTLTVHRHDEPEDAWRSVLSFDMSPHQPSAQERVRRIFWRRGLPMAFCGRDRLLAVALEPVVVVQCHEENSYHGASLKRRVMVIDVKTGKVAGWLPYDGFCTALQATHDGGLLMGLGEGPIHVASHRDANDITGYVPTYGDDTGVRLWRIDDFSLEKAYPSLPAHERVRGLALDPSGALFAAVCASGRIFVAPVHGADHSMTVCLNDPAISAHFIRPLVLWVSDSGRSAGGWPTEHRFFLRFPSMRTSQTRNPI